MNCILSRTAMLWDGRTRTFNLYHQKIPLYLLSYIPVKKEPSIPSFIGNGNPLQGQSSRQSWAIPFETAPTWKKTLQNASPVQK